jgi:HD superfamily phosphohydrolase
MDDYHVMLQLIALKLDTLKTDYMIRNAYDLGIISKEDYSKYIRNSIETEMEFANGPGSK